jgi:molybdopterin synthase sulfur carrier subunit
LRVNFYATLRDVVGKKTVELQLPDSLTVGQLVAEVVTQFPELRDKLYQEENILYGHVHVFVNGRDARFLPETYDTVISENDKIDIFPAVGGG